MTEKKDLVVLSHLRNNARMSLVELSKKMDVPVSTVYSWVNSYENNEVKKYTALLDFAKLGFHGRIYLAIKAADAAKREELALYLKSHKCINSLFRINFGYHYLVEAVFKNIGEAESFITELEEKFGIEKHVFNVIEELKKEEFLVNPDHAE